MGMSFWRSLHGQLYRADERMRTLKKVWGKGIQPLNGLRAVKPHAAWGAICCVLSLLIG